MQPERPGWAGRCQFTLTGEPTMDTTAIKEHMEVIGADGVHVGTVDHVDGDDQARPATTTTTAITPITRSCRSG